MKKIYKGLTADQKSRGVIFSSSLSANNQDGGTIHEVKADDKEREKKIERLLDDKFFNDSPWRYNIIRQ